MPYRTYTEEEKREIIFRDITTGEAGHVTHLEQGDVTDYRSVIGYFTQTILKELRLVSGFDVLHGKVKEFVSEYLFEKPVEIDDLNTLRNLSDIEASKMIVETFKQQINAMAVQDKGSAEIRDYIKLRETRPFTPKDQEYIVPQKSLFNKIIGDSRLELQFAAFLEKCPDVISYAKNCYAVHFKIDYVKADGDVADYYPDFIVKKSPGEIYIVEKKGLEDLDVPLKTARLAEWCKDINGAQNKVKYDWIFVDEESFKKYAPKTFNELVKASKNTSPAHLKVPRR